MRDEVYNLVLQIPRGKVCTYGKIARMIGRPGAARAVGRILHNNPDPQRIPCHRVVNHSGYLATGYRFGGATAQRELLLQEGVTFREDGRVNLEECLWKPDK
jgi:methylated-DNA-protein-cysteine methyltransferase-like protein